MKIFSIASHVNNKQPVAKRFWNNPVVTCTMAVIKFRFRSRKQKKLPRREKSTLPPATSSSHSKVKNLTRPDVTSTYTSSRPNTSTITPTPMTVLVLSMVVNSTFLPITTTGHRNLTYATLKRPKVSFGCINSFQIRILSKLCLFRYVFVLSFSDSILVFLDFPCRGNHGASSEHFHDYWISKWKGLGNEVCRFHQAFELASWCQFHLHVNIREMRLTFHEKKPNFY